MLLLGLIKDFLKKPYMYFIQYILLSSKKILLSSHPIFDVFCWFFIVLELRVSTYYIIIRIVYEHNKFYGWQLMIKINSVKSLDLLIKVEVTWVWHLLWHCFVVSYLLYIFGLESPQTLRRWTDFWELYYKNSTFFVNHEFSYILR